MKMLIFIVAILIQDGEARFVLKEGGFRTMFECEKQVATAHDPGLVCAEVPAAYLRK